MSSSESTPPALARADFDRAAAERDVPGLVAGLRQDAATRVLVLVGDAAPLETSGALAWLSPADVPEGGEWAFLGRDASGAALLTSVHARGDEELFAAPGGWGGLRAVGASLPPEEAGIFVTALSLGRWLRDSPFCPACGQRADLAQAGWSRTCGRCGRQHFPRTDPAVIVAVESATDPDALLLGANATWGGRRYSCFAGFVEAGESLEQAVRREVEEEAGVEVASIRYRGSQAWPYPRSLMVGFVATAADDAAARADGEEIVEVRWFSRAQIGQALGGGGPVDLPGPASIAHGLISDWHSGAA